MTPLTRDEAREQVARAIHARTCCPDWPSPWCDGPSGTDYSNIAAAMSVLWPEVERLRAELDHAHAVIARHVEPRRGPDCTPGAPLTAEQGAPRVPGRDGGERG